REPLDMEVKVEVRRPPCLERHVQPCVAELLGSTFFTFTGVLAVVDTGGEGRLQLALAHGMALGSAVAVLGGV
ncbi:AQP8 protein, partial [Mionectes macconnelli]|nr:AQP8 protein [Mionectes macconnelli]